MGEWVGWGWVGKWGWGKGRCKLRNRYTESAIDVQGVQEWWGSGPDRGGRNGGRLWWIDKV